MESKKINQLATELAPDLSDLTIIGDPTTGISKKITLSQMASLFTGTVEEYATLAAFPLVGVADTIYIALDTNVIYRYDTSLSAYVILSPNIINSLVFSDANGFDGTITLVGSVATLSITTALTLGSVPFIGASGALTQDNSNLFFDDTNNRLGIATASPTTPLDVFGSGIIGRFNATSTNNAYLGFASNGTNKWSAGNVQSDHRFRIFSEANSAELITILQTGEFGIGIANPLTKLHIDGGATALIANLDANVSVAKSVSFRSDNSSRINLEVSGTESGSNAGADFFIRRYSDAGSLIDTPLTITRSTGVVSLASALPISSGGTGSITQNFVDLTTAQTIAGAKTFSSEISITSGLISISGNATSGPPTGGVGIRHTANRLLIYGGTTDFTVQKNSNAGPNLTILESGPATFVSSVSALSFTSTGVSNGNGIVTVQDQDGRAAAFKSPTPIGGVASIGSTTNHDFRINTGDSSNVLILGTKSGTNWLSFASTGAATFSGAFEAGRTGGAVTRGDLTVDPTSTAAKVIIGRISSTGGDNTELIGVNRAGVQGWSLGPLGNAIINTNLYVGGANTTLIDYSSNVARFYGGSGTNTFGLGANSTIYYQGDNSQLYPTADNARSIGLGSFRYTAIYAVNGTIQTSDEREKTDIINSDLGLEFVSKLRPVSFKWKIGQNNVTNETIIDEEGNETTKEIVTPRAGIRTHYGLIAQEVEELLNGKDFGGFIHDKESDLKGLRYDQFVPLLIKAIQELKAEIDILKAK